MREEWWKNAEDDKKGRGGIKMKQHNGYFRKKKI